MTLTTVLYILAGFPLTIALTIGSFFIGCVLAVPLLLALRSRWFFLRALGRVIVLIIRGLPPIVWLFIIFFGLGTGYIRMNPFTASLVGFGLIAMAYMAEIYRGALLAVPHGQFDAVAALGLGRWAAFRDVLAPQVFRVALPSAVSYFIALMKETAIASTIGVMELTFRGTQLAQTTFFGLGVFTIVAIAYIVFSLPAAWLSRVVDNALQAKVTHG